jgi:2-polyprenyl-3-methyl-5-hydroxy-6-metoxy-1,4-benzoquinol methylase
MSRTSLTAAYFAQLYADSDDPWNFETRWYEQRKYALTLAALPLHRYQRALEPGCSIGILTEQLAHRCDEVVATDVVDSALTRTSDRMLASDARGHVETRTWALGSKWNLGHFDLIVLSEVCYYLDAQSLYRATEDVAKHLEPGGTLICVHWRHEVVDYPLSGDAVHAILRVTPGLTKLGTYSDADMLIDVFTTSDSPTSVAAAEGLVE